MPSADRIHPVPGHPGELRRPADPADQAELADAASVDAGAAAGAAAELVIDLDVATPADGVRTVTVSGEVDALTVPNLRALLADQFDAAPRMVVLDLREVVFLGSTGLAALVDARARAERGGVTLRLVCAGHAVLRPLAATGLADQFETYPDLAAALR